MSENRVGDVNVSKLNRKGRDSHRFPPSMQNTTEFALLVVDNPAFHRRSDASPFQSANVYISYMFQR